MVIYGSLALPVFAANAVKRRFLEAEKAEMPFLGQLAGEYADRGVRIIGIVIDVGDDQTALENARSIAEATGAGYLHLIPNEYLWNRFCVQSDYIPMSWFLNERGELLDDEPLVGSMGYEGWKSGIDSFLGDPE